MKNKLYCFLAVIIVALTFTWYRSGTGFVWDDSPHLVYNLFETPKPLAWEGVSTIPKILHTAFSSPTSSGYRPLSASIDCLGRMLFIDPDMIQYPWFLGVGLILGALCVTFFKVSEHFLKSKNWAVFSVLLFIFSAPMITGSWIVFAGIQAIVPLLICSGLLLYWKLLETEKHKKRYGGLLFFIMFFG
ncbi:MAG: hypothetical protein KAS23_13520, partial [Anaerohalosphaera sp.]|nr:hypothetical protein [Anaerohalosphaera sp.]